MKRKWMSILTIVLALGLLCCSNAIAEDGQTDTPSVRIQISPVSKQISIVPGESSVYDITVENTGSEEFRYKTYATPYYVMGKDYDLTFSTENSYTEIAKWITFEDVSGDLKTEITRTIAPGERQTIKYHIDVPQNAPVGGQYATLFAESINDNSQSSSGVKTASRVGSIVYAHTEGDINLSAEINDVNFNRLLLKDKISASSTVKNSGNIDFGATEFLTVKNIFGKTIYEGNKVEYTLPNTEKNISIEWQDTPFIGLFNVTYKVVAADITEEKTNLVIVLPFFILVIMLLLLTIIVIWVTILIKRYRERRLRRKSL